jgi:hypothetical protein
MLIRARRRPDGRMRVNLRLTRREVELLKSVVETAIMGQSNLGFGHPGGGHRDPGVKKAPTPVVSPACESWNPNGVCHAAVSDP